MNYVKGEEVLLVTPWTKGSHISASQNSDGFFNLLFYSSLLGLPLWLSW